MTITYVAGRISLGCFSGGAASSLRASSKAARISIFIGPLFILLAVCGFLPSPSVSNISTQMQNSASYASCGDNGTDDVIDGSENVMVMMMIVQFNRAILI